MKLALVGLACFAAGWGSAWVYGTQRTVTTLLRVPIYNYRGRP